MLILNSMTEAWKTVTITLIQLSTFIFAVFVFMMTPGPGVFATIAKAMNQGSWSVFPLAIGLAMGDAIYMVFSAYGLSALATNFNTLFTLIKFVGAGYLFYLAYKMWVSIPPEINVQPTDIKAYSPEFDAQHTESNFSTNRQNNEGLKSVSSGFLISISNPKVILFYVSLLPSFFPVANLTSIDIGILCAIIFLSAVCSMMIYAFIAGYAQNQLKSPKSRQIFNRIGASFMGMAGGWLLTKG